MKNFLTTIICLAGLALQTPAQTTYSGQTAYGGSQDEFAESLSPTSDGGYLIAGYTLSYAGNYSPFMTRLDSLGGVIWSQMYGTGYAYGYDAKPTSDGGYILAGYLDAFGGFNRDYLLIKTDSNGDTTWTHAYGETGADHAFAVIQTADGGYLTGGRSTGSAYDVLLIKTDGLGDTTWTKRYNSSSESCEDIIQTSDGGYAIAGLRGTDMLLMKIDSTGNVVFTKTYSGPAAGTEAGHALIETPDGGFIIAGETTSFGAGVTDMLVVRTDTAGAVQWARTFGGIGNDYAYAINKVGVSSYIVAGSTNSFGSGGVDGYAVQVDIYGAVEWSKTYGNVGNDYLKGVLQGADGGLVYAGHTTSNGAGMSDIYFLRADQYGNIQCDQVGAATLVSSPIVVEASPAMTVSSGTGVRSTGRGQIAIALGVDTACAFLPVDAEANNNKYQKVLGGLSDDFCYSVDRAVDGGYIFAGYTQSFGAGGDDVYLVKTDENADVVWSKTYGGTGSDQAFAVIQTIDGGYAIAGKTNSFGAGLNDGYLLRTDANGDTLWTKVYGTNSTDQIQAIIELADGSLMLAGSKANDFLMIKTNSVGDTIWTRVFGAGGTETAYSIAQTNDGGFIMAGKTNGSGAGGDDVLVIKTDENGDSLWAYTYGGTNTDIANSVILTADGGYIIGGESISYVIGFGSDLFLLKLNSEGVQQWAQTYGGSGYSYGGYASTGTDNTYSILGRTTGFSSYPTDTYLINADTAGNMNWSKLYGYILDPDNDDADNGYGIVQQTADGGYMIAGSSQSFGAGDYDFYAIKTDRNGVSGGCFERDPATAEQSVVFTGAVVTLVQTVGLSVGSTATQVNAVTSNSKKLNIETDVVVSNVSCNGGNDGVGDLTISGGSGPYDFNWSTGGSNEDLTSSVAGNFAVTVSDVYGCSVSDSAIITEPTVLTSAISGTNISCNGGNDGTTTITPSGGTAPYHIVWSTGQITATAVSLYAGTYTVSIVDDKGCPGTNIITITQPNQLATSVANTEVTCFGGSDGSASVTATDGTSPYSYLWSNTATTSGISGVAAGTYFVTTTDSCGAGRVDSVVVSEPNNLALLATKMDVSCFGMGDGSAQVVATDGTAPYTYSWSTTATTSSIATLAPGPYAVTVTDACSITDNTGITIAEPLVLTSSMSKTDVSCNGGGDGATTATPAGGTAPYNYLWNVGQITSTAVALFPGTYSVNIFDANGCLTSNSIAVTQPAVLSGSITSTNTTCNGGNDGSADLTVAGGTLPYTFLWSGTETTEDISGQTAGNYTVTVTDACGATFNGSVTIGEPAVLSSTILQQNVSCSGNVNGSANLTTAGGTAPYTYLWSNSGTTEDISGLAAATYFITVSDACADSTTNSVTITEPAPLTGTIAKTDVTCNGGGDGTATVTASGGTAPYNYLWNNGQGTSTAIGLFPGTYSVNVFDVNGCLTSNGISLTQPNALSGSLTAVAATCNGGADGSADLTITGGTLPYTFAWSGSETTEDIGAKSAGTYTVTVTDGCGSLLVDSIGIGEPTALSSSITGQHVSCNGNSDGSINLSGTGGTAPYTYMWSTTETTEDISGLAAATYFVTISDACADSITNSVAITEPAALTSTISKTDVTCNGGGDGAATVTASGGTAPYNYLWNNGQGTSTAVGLFPGAYSVNITDVKGCLTSNLVAITQPIALAGSVTGTDVSCNGGNDGQAGILMSGGTAPYTYLWNDTGAQSNATATGLLAGAYQVTVTDGCSGTYSQSITVDEPAAVTASFVVTDVTCNGAGNGSIDMSPSGGTTPYTFSWSSSDTTEDLSALVPANYIITLTDACGAVRVDSMEITEPAILSTIMSKTDVSCNSGGNGTATVSVSGGIAPYNYLWNNSQSAATAIGLFPGNYSVNITDANGCLTSDLVTIVQPLPLTINLVSTDVNCSVGNDGTATANVNFGTPPYTYLWMPGGDTNSTAINLAEGTYTVTVSDSCGAMKTDSVVVNGPGTLNLVLNASGITCNGFNDGSVDATVTSGSAPYTYLWSTGATTEDLGALSPGMYTLTVSDSCNTTIVDSVQITEPPALMSTMSSTNISCFGMGDGTATVNPSGGTAPYLYTWNNGQFAATSVGLYAGNYSVNVLDNNGCLISNLVTINEPPLLDLQVSVVSATCGNADGSAAVNVTGGTGAYTYLWSTGGSSSTELALADGQYGISVTDENGCPADENITVITESLPQQLCIVTVDSSNSKNVLVWENPQIPNIASYNIYREIAGIGYTLIGNKLWSESSEFTDASIGIDPTITSYRYKISAVDTCGNESVLSDYHETMHLAAPILSGGKVSLIWDNYEGFGFGYYRILRDTGTGIFTAIDSVTSSNTSYTDINPPTGSATYVIEVVASSTCTSDKTKNYNSSKSNTSSMSGAGSQLSATTSSTDVTYGLCDGTATVVATGGTPPLTYTWDGNAGNQTTSTATNLCPGTYGVVVTDSLDNQVMVFATVGTTPGMGEYAEERELHVYPNPNTGVFTVEWSKTLDPERLLLYNSLGQIVYDSEVEPLPNNQTIDLSTQSPGLYFLQVNTGETSLYKKVIIE